MKKKVALFFHLENENEKEAYELLDGLGRKKSAAIIKLLLDYKDEVNSCKDEKRKNITKSKRLLPVGKKSESVETDKKESLPVHEAVIGEEIPQNDIKHERSNVVKEEKKLDNSLILNGLQSFRL